MGASDRRHSNAETPPERRATDRHETELDGQFREEASSSTNRQFQGSGSTYELDSRPSRGNGETGTLQNNLINYKFDSTVIEYGGAKTKYKANVDAIRLLKQLEADHRLATTEEQYTLARYTGFGGISKAFDKEAKDWEYEYNELKELLTPTEYESARASTLTAFYTEPIVIQAMYSGLLELGFDSNARVLEPSMGVGNFFGSLPSQLTECELHGVELDDLTGRIAKQLYQKANINICGYQDVKYPDNHFHLSIGNVPFGDYNISDEKRSRLIHDYFFEKTIEKLIPNGVLAFITSKGTLDKANPSFRKYLAEHAELIGAVRLPDTAFKAIGGTEVTADIIFLRKKESPSIDDSEWIEVGVTDSGVPINKYYLSHPENLLGEMVFESSQFGQSAALKSFGSDFDLYSELNNRILGFTKGKVKEITKPSPNSFLYNDVSKSAEVVETLPADPNVKNFTYTIFNSNLYYRTNDEMVLANVPKKNIDCIKSLHEIRVALRKVIDIQLNPYDENVLKEYLDELNTTYDKFVSIYGFINDTQNKRIFKDDSDLPLLLSLEDKKDKSYVKAKIFSQATINPQEDFIPQSYEDLITLSMTIKGKIDIPFMADTYNVTPVDVLTNLSTKIYINPAKVPQEFYSKLNEYIEFVEARQVDEISQEDIQNFAFTELATVDCFEHSDEYLTGNVKAKLDYATLKANTYPLLYNNNVVALELVQPPPLSANEVDYKLGSSWIDKKYYRDFIYEIGEVPFWLKQKGDEQNESKICLTYHDISSEYIIYGKTKTSGVNVTSTYGSERRNFFQIVEDSLNLKDSKVYDTVLDGDKPKQKLNAKETQIARQKQVLIKNEFKNWIENDPSRLTQIVSTYNNRFNVYRTRTYDGSHLTFPGMTNDITLRPHQRNAIARCLYSGKNVLLGHVVGAGKTYTMIASAMELKRIGIANKPLFVVPNHLTEQWGSDYIKLYPNANILVATKKDFQPSNRKQFISKMATGNYDAIIIGHSQFEKIPMSPEYIKGATQDQINEITNAIESMNRDNGQRYTVKKLESQKKKLEEKLKKLNSNKKDDVITFEQTGVDHIFVDEAHYYKNCFVHTKMSNVAGVTTTNAQKSYDMLMKSKYISEKNNGRGVIFATGTPISNSMTEMFVLQRYLQPDALKAAGLNHFDEWASTFGETQTALELKPEGTGYRMRTRFAKFHNLPELVNMFSQVADIKVAEDLKLPIPRMNTGKPIIEVCQPSDFVKAYIQSLVPRSEAVRNGLVEPYEDNMLKITHEGRAVALDASLVDKNAPVDYNSKIYRCCNNVAKIYQESIDDKACQLVFLDFGIELYDKMKDYLVSQHGLKADEIAFIGDSKTEEQTASLFAKCRSGEIRVLLGSTQKMGAGTNVQDRLIAVHHLDCPWRPADIEQRDGRILRQGNMFDEVSVYRYVTENTFDAYLWQIQENKQKFITQIMTNKSAVRSCDDIEEAVLDCAEVKALATGNPKIKEKMNLDNDITVLLVEKSSYLRERVNLQKMITEHPQILENCNQRIENIREDIKTFDENKPDEFKIQIDGVHYIERTKAAEALHTMLSLDNMGERFKIGSYGGLDIYADRDGFTRCLKIEGVYSNKVLLGDSSLGNITRIENACMNLVELEEKALEDAKYIRKQIERASEEIKKPFIKEDELREKLQRQVALNAELELNEKTQIIMEEDDTNDLGNDNAREKEDDFENEID